jgi:predicted TIM-barrel enzyme
MTNNPNSIDDATLINAVKECYEREETDLMNGGVAAATVAEHDDVPYTPSTTQSRLSTLAETSDDLVRVIGLNPESQVPRASYVPAAEYDDEPTV